MSEVEAPDELPCEKCGKMTAYDGLIGSGLACEHCGTADPHTATGSTGKALWPFLLFFVGAIIFYGNNPFHWSEDRMFVTLFGIFCLMFFFLGVLPVYLALRKVKKASREKVEEEGVGAKLTEEEALAAAWGKKTRKGNPNSDE